MVTQTTLFVCLFFFIYLFTYLLLIHFSVRLITICLNYTITSANEIQIRAGVFSDKKKKKKKKKKKTYSFFKFSFIVCSDMNFTDIAFTFTAL